MPDWLRVLIYGGGGALLLEAVRTVSQRRQMGADVGKKKADTVDVNVTIAGRVRDEAVEDWERARTELAAMRDRLTEREREEAQYRRDVEGRLAELGAELRAEKAEKLAVKRENSELKARVDELEAEVARLKANR